MCSGSLMARLIGAHWSAASKSCSVINFRFQPSNFVALLMISSTLHNDLTSRSNHPRCRGIDFIRPPRDWEFHSFSETYIRGVYPVFWPFPKFLILEVNFDAEFDGVRSTTDDCPPLVFTRTSFAAVLGSTILLKGSAAGLRRRSHFMRRSSPQRCRLLARGM